MGAELTLYSTELQSQVDHIRDGCYFQGVPYSEVQHHAPHPLTSKRVAYPGCQKFRLCNPVGNTVVTYKVIMARLWRGVFAHS